VEFFEVQNTPHDSVFLTGLADDSVKMQKSNTLSNASQKKTEALLALNFFLTNCKKFVVSSDVIELKKFLSKYANQTNFSTEEISN